MILKIACLVVKDYWKSFQKVLLYSLVMKLISISRVKSTNKLCIWDELVTPVNTTKSLYMAIKSLWCKISTDSVTGSYVFQDDNGASFTITQLSVREDFHGEETWL